MPRLTIAARQAKARELFELAGFWSHKAGQANIDGLKAVGGQWSRQAGRYQTEGEALVASIIADVSR